MVPLHHLELLLALSHQLLLLLLLRWLLLSLLNLLRCLGRLSRLCLWRYILLLICLLGRRLRCWL
jgi:hypothetical protein